MRAFVHYNSRNDWGNLEQLPGRRARAKSRWWPARSRIPSASHGAVAGCEIVFHLAALIGIPYSYPRPEQLRRHEHARDVQRARGGASAVACERVVHTSTSETYGTAQYTPIDERHPLQGQSPYSASKIGADKIAESYFRSMGLAVSDAASVQHVRSAPVAARGDPDDHRAGIAGDTGSGSGRSSPSAISHIVTDTAQAFIAVAAAAGAVGQTLNSGTGKGITIGELARLILRLTESEAEIVHDDAARAPRGQRGVRARVRRRPPARAHRLASDGRASRRAWSRRSPGCRVPPTRGEDPRLHRLTR